MKKFTPVVLAAALAISLSACGEPDEKKPSMEKPKGAEPALPKTNRIVRANKIAQQAAAERLALMKQITAVLRPIRSPEEALTKESELKQLFDEYAKQKGIAAQEGIEGRVLEEITKHPNRDDYNATRTEFQQYVLLVKQLGEPQREMMNRLMGTTDSMEQPLEGLEEAGK